MGFFVGLCIGLAAGLVGGWLAHRKWGGTTAEIRLPK